MDMRKSVSRSENGDGHRRSFEQRVRQAVVSLQAEGKVPSFYQVARRANVARSTLYRNASLREIVCRGRDEAPASVVICDRPAATGDPPTGVGGFQCDVELQADAAALRQALVDVQAERDALARELSEIRGRGGASCFVYSVCHLDDAA